VGRTLVSKSGPSRALRPGKNLGYAFGHAGGAIHPFFDYSQFFGKRWIRLFGGQRSSANLTSTSGITHNDFDARTQMSLRSPAQAGH
jgi:hypothetical protein